MNKKDVLSEPPSRGPRPDSQETSPLLNAYSDLDHVPTHTENAEDGAALRRNEHDGKNIVHKSHYLFLSEYTMTGDNGEMFDNVPKDKRQLGQVTTCSYGICQWN